jgi:hypothetical protein
LSQERFDGLSPSSRGVCSEENEDFPDVTFDMLDLFAENVEADSLGEGTALADSDDITDGDTESRRAVDGDLVVAFLESSVLGEVVQVIASNNEGPGHFASRDDNTPNQKKESTISIRAYNY